MNREERERTQGRFKKAKRPKYAVGQWWRDHIGRTYCITEFDQLRAFARTTNGGRVVFFYRDEGLADDWTMVGKW